MHALLTHYLARLETLPPLPGAVRQAVDWLCAMAYPDQLASEVHALRAAADHLAVRVAEDQANPYHNATHAAEATWAIVTLLVAEHQRRQAQQAPALPWDAAQRAVLAMIGHDLGHPGTFVAAHDPQVGAIERQSAQEVYRLLQGLAIDADLARHVTQLIEQTEPAHAVPEARATYGAVRDDTTLLPVLVAEADILASALAPTGTVRGQRLAQEWEAQVPTYAAKLRTPEGRVGFLDHLVWASPASQWLGLPALIAAERHRLRAPSSRRPRPGSQG